jgi:hypothetical protein
MLVLFTFFSRMLCCCLCYQLISVGMNVDPGFSYWQGQAVFSLLQMFRSAVGPTQPCIQCVPAIPSPDIKRSGPEVDHFSPSGA